MNLDVRSFPTRCMEIFAFTEHSSGWIDQLSSCSSSYTHSKSELVRSSAV